MKQFLIAIDQALNTLVWAKVEGFGKADETLSARAFRLHDRRTWGAFQNFLDMIFRLFGQEDHCMWSYLNEHARRHLPRAYR